ncbi:hypothetical protein MD484_g4720, partial [Candolleomyces efflorescens]
MSPSAPSSSISRIPIAPKEALKEIRPPSFWETWRDPSWRGFASKLDRQFQEILGYQEQVAEAMPMSEELYAKMDATAQKLSDLKGVHHTRAQLKQHKGARSSCVEYARSLRDYKQLHSQSVIDARRGAILESQRSHKERVDSDPSAMAEPSGKSSSISPILRAASEPGAIQSSVLPDSAPAETIPAERVLSTPLPTLSINGLAIPAEDSEDTLPAQDVEDSPIQRKPDLPPASGPLELHVHVSGDQDYLSSPTRSPSELEDARRKRTMLASLPIYEEVISWLEGVSRTKCAHWLSRGTAVQRFMIMRHIEKAFTTLSAPKCTIQLSDTYFARKQLRETLVPTLGRDIAQHIDSFKESGWDSNLKMEMSGIGDVSEQVRHILAVGFCTVPLKERKAFLIMVEGLEHCNKDALDLMFEFLEACVLLLPTCFLISSAPDENLEKRISRLLSAPVKADMEWAAYEERIKRETASTWRSLIPF